MLCWRALFADLGMMCLFSDGVFRVRQTLVDINGPEHIVIQTQRISEYPDGHPIIQRKLLERNNAKRPPAGLEKQNSSKACDCSQVLLASTRSHQFCILHSPDVTNHKRASHFGTHAHLQPPASPHQKSDVSHAQVEDAGIRCAMSCIAVVRRIELDNTMPSLMLTYQTMFSPAYCSLEDICLRSPRCDKMEAGDGAPRLADMALRSVLRYRHELTADVLREVEWYPVGRKIWVAMRAA